MGRRWRVSFPQGNYISAWFLAIFAVINAYIEQIVPGDVSTGLRLMGHYLGLPPIAVIGIFLVCAWMLAEKRTATQYAILHLVDFAYVGFLIFGLVRGNFGALVLLPISYYLRSLFVTAAYIHEKYERERLAQVIYQNKINKDLLLKKLERFERLFAARGISFE